MSVRVEAFIISWTGQHENAEKIRSEISPFVSIARIIYSDRNDLIPPPGRGVLVPNDWFYGKKFQTILNLYQAGMLLQITADVSCSDWEGLISGMVQAYSNDLNLGVWSPNVDFTAYTLKKTSIYPLRDSSLMLVTNTDSIVWAMNQSVAIRMKKFDYQTNNLGWGIDIAAAMHCHASGRLVVVDTAIPLFHPAARGYETSNAKYQFRRFLRQLSFSEKLLLICTTRALRKYKRWRLLLFSITRSRQFRRMYLSS